MTTRNKAGRPNDYILSHFNIGKKHTEEHKRKISKAISGENNPFYGKRHSKESIDKISQSAKIRFKDKERHPNWKGGIQPIYQQIRNCEEYINWRINVFKRDNYKCSQCNKTSNSDLTAHHIYPFVEIINDYGIKDIEQARECKILWDINNGITFCANCHRKIHSKMSRQLKKFK